MVHAKVNKSFRSFFELLAAYRNDWSVEGFHFDSVEEGVRFMKDGDTTAALASLNKAVELNKKNVEALVARGALYALSELSLYFVVC